MTEKLPDLDKTRPRPSLLLAMIVSGTMFMAQLDSTIIATALPQMAGSFNVQPVSLSIGISIYLMVQVILLPASNWISDRLGARRVFAAAVLIFTMASIFCGLSSTLWQFVLSRMLQGAAAALMTPVGRTVLVRATRKEDLVSILTMTSIPMLLAPTLGPPIGGAIVTYLSWPWVFFINIPVGLVSALLIMRYVPDFRESERRPFDWTGFVLTGIAVSGLVYGLDRITAPGIDRTVPAICLISGLLFGVVAVRHSLNVSHPLLSLAPLRFQTFRIPALGGGTLARIPMRALPFIMPLMLQIGMGLNAFIAGLLVMALSGGDLVIKPLVKGTLRRFGYRSALIASVVVTSIGILFLAWPGAGLPLAIIFGLLAIIGIARSVLFSGMSSLIYVEIDEKETGAANVLWSVILQLSNAIAISLAVIALNAAAWSHGTYGSEPSLTDFRLTLVMLALIGIPTWLSFRNLAADAGQRLSGHRAQKR